MNRNLENNVKFFSKNLYGKLGLIDYCINIFKNDFAVQKFDKINIENEKMRSFFLKF